jgi:hypothetical protein
MTLHSLPSRTTPSVRCDTWGRKSLPVQVPIAQWTVKERFALISVEAAMIKYAASLEAKIRAFGTDKANVNDDSQATTIQLLREYIKTAPDGFTAKDAADAIGRKSPTVTQKLGDLVKQGRLTSFDEKGPGVLKKPRKYYRPQGPKPIRPNTKALLQKTLETQAKVLQNIVGDMTTEDIAASINRTPRHTRTILHNLRKDGKIEIASRRKLSPEGAATIFWRKA